MSNSSYIKNEILTFPIKISTMNNKKTIKFPKHWNNLSTLEECKDVFEEYNSYNNFAILTGSKNNITILDIDNPDIWESLKEELSIEYPDNGVIVDTRRGFHLYYKYEKNLSTTQNILNGIDIKNDKSNCTLPPSYYILENGDKIQYSFRDGSLQENILKLKDLPEIPIKLINKFNSLNKIIKEIPSKQIKVKVYNLIDQKIFKVKRYLHKLNKEDLSNYNIVTKLIYYICQYSEGNVDMLIFLKDYFNQTKYEDQIEYQWNHIKLLNDVDKFYNSFKKFIRERISDNLQTNYFDLDILLELLKKRKSLAIEYFNRHFGIIISNDNGKIMYCEKEYLNNEIKNIILITSEINLINKLPKCISIEIDEKKKIPFTQYWLEHFDRNVYRKIIFEPYSSINNINDVNDLNMYLGLKNKYLETFHIDESKIRLPLKHLKDVLCDSNEIVYKYLLHWLAHIVQKPNKRMGVAVLCKSIQGVGKNLFFEHLFGNLIIGKNHSINIADSNQVVGQFNSILERMIFTIVNELKSDGDIIKMSNYMKSLITDKSQKIEKKGVDAIYTNNYNNFVFLTNNHNVVNIELHDRRYLCIEASSKYIKDFEYRSEMITQLMDEDVGLHFFHYLMRLNIETFDYTNIPMTPYKKQLMYNSIPAIMNWFSSYLKDNMNHTTTDLDYIEVTLDELFQKYKLESNGNIIRISTFKTQLLDERDKGLHSIEKEIIDNTICLKINILKTFSEMKEKSYILDL